MGDVSADFGVRSLAATTIGRDPTQGALASMAHPTGIDDKDVCVVCLERPSKDVRVWRGFRLHVECNAAVRCQYRVLAKASRRRRSGKASSTTTVELGEKRCFRW